MRRILLLGAGKSSGYLIRFLLDKSVSENLFITVAGLDVNEMQAQGYIENWVCYKSHDFSAKELTVFPGQTVTIKDSAAYGIIVMQGHGTMGVWDIETPALIRYGQLTNDEFFISEAAAKDGVKIVNNSDTDPIVILKHFGPRNPDLVL